MHRERLNANESFFLPHQNRAGAQQVWYPVYTKFMSEMNRPNFHIGSYFIDLLLKGTGIQSHRKAFRISNEQLTPRRAIARFPFWYEMPLTFNLEKVALKVWGNPPGSG